MVSRKPGDHLTLQMDPITIVIVVVCIGLLALAGIAGWYIYRLFY